MHAYSISLRFVSFRCVALRFRVTELYSDKSSMFMLCYAITYSGMLYHTLAYSAILCYGVHRIWICIIYGTSVTRMCYYKIKQHHFNELQTPMSSPILFYRILLLYETKMNILLAFFV